MTPDYSLPGDRAVLAPLLRVWRTRALYALLTVIAVAGLPAYVTPLFNAYRTGGITPLLWVYLGIYIAFVSLALAPALSDRARTMGLLALGYANGIASLARLGLAGSGRLYLLVMPVVAALLLGGRAGYWTAALSFLIYVAFTVLGGLNLLPDLVTPAGNPVDVAAWIEAGAAFLVFLIALAVLVERFTSLLVRALASQQKTSNELAGAARELREREERLTRQNEMLAALHDTSVGVARAQDVSSLLQDLVARAVGVIGAAYGWLYLVDEDRDELVVRVGTGIFERHVGLRLQRGEGLSGQIWEVGQPLMIENYRFWPNRSRRFGDDPVGPAMGVPLYLEGKVAGVLGLTRVFYSRPFQQDELDAMLRLAELAGIALANARLHASLQQELAGRIEAQSALQAAYQDLERRVSERTQELANLNVLERERRGEAERSRRVAEGMREIVAALNSGQSLSQTLDFIVNHACRMVNSDGAAILRLDPGDEWRAQALRVQSGCGLDPAFIVEAALPLSESLAGQALTERQTIGVGDMAAQLKAVVERGDMPDYLRRPELKGFLERFQAMLVTPLVVDSQPYGVIALYYNSPQRFNEEELEQARSLADQAALAIESARLRERAGQAAAIEERNRLARELHDSVTQSLYSVTLYGEAAARQLDAGNSTTAAAHLRDLRDTARDALREMRLLIYELRPPDLERVGLATSLRMRLQAVEMRGGIEAHFEVEGEETIPLAVQQELYHIAREALNNALKHARATRISLVIDYREGHRSLVLTDNGVGFDPDEVASAGGMGLSTMHERAGRIGAKLSVASDPESGTRVCVEF